MVSALRLRFPPRLAILPPVRNVSDLWQIEAD